MREFIRRIVKNYRNSLIESLAVIIAAANASKMFTQEMTTRSLLNQEVAAYFKGVTTTEEYFDHSGILGVWMRYGGDMPLVLLRGIETEARLQAQDETEGLSIREIKRLIKAWIILSRHNRKLRLKATYTESLSADLLDHEMTLAQERLKLTQ